jgi:hypothetical protein
MTARVVVDLSGMRGKPSNMKPAGDDLAAIFAPTSFAHDEGQKVHFAIYRGRFPAVH